MRPSHVSHMQMESKTLTSRFAQFCSELQPESVPRDVMQVARWLLLDTIGCIAAALKTNPAQQIASVGKLFGGTEDVAQAGETEPQGVARGIRQRATREPSRLRRNISGRRAFWRGRCCGGHRWRAGLERKFCRSSHRYGSRLRSGRPDAIRHWSDDVGLRR
jgi:hypothetical protein